MKFLKTLLLIFIFMCIALYANRHMRYYVSSSTIDSDRVAVIAIDQNDPLLCGKIKISLDPLNPNSELELKNSCYYKVAEAKKDITVCENVVSETRPYSKSVNDCKYKVIATIGDVSKCEDFSSASEIKECQTQVQEENEAFNNCESMSDQNERDECFGVLTNAIGNVNICDTKIKADRWKNFCYFNILKYNQFQSLRGLTKDDRLLCEKMSESNEKVGCFNYFDKNFK